MKILGILVIPVLVYLGISSFSAIRAIEVPRIPLNDTPASVGLDYEDVSFPSRDNVTLRGWYIPATGETTIIMISSGAQNRIDPGIGAPEMTRDLVMKGFNILLFDQRGRGESEGKGLLLVNASQDIGGAVDYIKNRNSGDIIIMGFSLGAALSLTCQEDVAAIISDTSFTNVKEMFIRQTTIETNLPEPIIKFLAPGIFLMAKVIYGYDAVNPIDRVADISCPILFIHGEADNNILPDDVVKLFEASDNPSDELWIVPGAGHCQGYRSSPISYIDIITKFLTR